jgi:hypothetical protein
MVHFCWIYNFRRPDSVHKRAYNFCRLHSRPTEERVLTTHACPPSPTHSAHTLFSSHHTPFLSPDLVRRAETRVTSTERAASSRWERPHAVTSSGGARLRRVDLKRRRPCAGREQQLPCGARIRSDSNRAGLGSEAAARGSGGSTLSRGDCAGPRLADEN